MNCPICGAESTYGLRYCKRCGGNLAAPGQPIEYAAPPGRTTGAAWALAIATAVITLGGLGIVFGHALDMARPAPWGGQSAVGNPTAIVMAMIAFGSMTIFGVVAMLIRLFTRVLGSAQESSRSNQVSAQAFNPQSVTQLPAPPAAVSSVTEHTTRTFDRHRFGEQNAHE
jgi:hypothetical protein